MTIKFVSGCALVNCIICLSSPSESVFDIIAKCKLSGASSVSSESLVCILL